VVYGRDCFVVEVAKVDGVGFGYVGVEVVVGDGFGHVGVEVVVVDGFGRAGLHASAPVGGEYRGCIVAQ
jgi:hypothetical protein